MGALHRGHAKLLEIARRENDFVVASIFVNPIQFDRKEDLENYPRTMEDDLRVCDACGVDLVFAPSASDLYPREQLTFVESPALSAHLCGAHRPDISAAWRRSCSSCSTSWNPTGPTLARRMRSNWRSSGGWLRI